MKFAVLFLVFLLSMPAQADQDPVDGGRKKTIRELHQERQQKLEARRLEILEGKKDKTSSQESNGNLEQLQTEKENLDREINELHQRIKERMERRRQVEQSIYKLKKEADVR